MNKPHLRLLNDGSVWFQKDGWRWVGNIYKGKFTGHSGWAEELGFNACI